jgi:class 3 adenylate cyclase
MQQALQPLGLEIRAGVHAGEIELRGEDIAGVAVHIAQRVQSFAPAGEVFVSETVPRLVAGSGIDFADHGEHELKGVPGTWRLHSAIL